MNVACFKCIVTMIHALPLLLPYLTLHSPPENEWAPLGRWLFATVECDVLLSTESVSFNQGSRTAMHYTQWSAENNCCDHSACSAGSASQVLLYLSRPGRKSFVQQGYRRLLSALTVSISDIMLTVHMAIRENAHACYAIAMPTGGHGCMCGGVGVGVGGWVCARVCSLVFIQSTVCTEGKVAHRAWSQWHWRGDIAYDVHLAVCSSILHSCVPGQPILTV